MDTVDKAMSLRLPSPWCFFIGCILLTLVPLQFLSGAYGVTVEQLRGTAAFAILALALVLISDCSIQTVQHLRGRRS